MLFISVTSYDFCTLTLSVILDPSGLLERMCVMIEALFDHGAKV
jgi:hypothetical protein